MKGQGISFAQVLMKKDKGYSIAKSKSRSSLLELLNQWQENPHADYTLYLDESSMTRQPTSQALLGSKTSKGGMFDSWIEKQGLENKENTDSLSNRYIGNREDMGPKKIMLHSKGQRKDFYREVKEEGPKYFKNNRSMVNEIELSCNSNYSQDLYDSKQDNCKRYPTEGLSIDIDCRNKPSVKENPMKTINSFKQIQNHKKNTPKTPEEENSKTTKHPGKAKFNELQHLVEETDHIHQQIAEMAHKFVLEEKKKSQEQEELLLSIQEVKRLSLKEKKSSEKEKDQKKEEQNRNKLKQQTRKQIQNFLKNTQNKVHVPSFGGTSQVSKQEPRQSIKQGQQYPQNIKNGDKPEVGYSFSTNLLPQPPTKQSIPDLNIPQTETIPMIQEIASERHQSEANEEIENMYNKWKQEQVHEEIVSEHIQNIESVSFYKIPESEKDTNEIIRQMPIENIIEEKEEKAQSIKQSSENGKSSEEKTSPKVDSAEKPEINVNIPSSFREEDQENSGVKSQDRLNFSETKKEPLVLSESSKKWQSPQNDKKISHDEDVDIKLFTNENSVKEDSIEKIEEEKQQTERSPTSAPNRDMYLSIQEEDQMAKPEVPKQFQTEKANVPPPEEKPKQIESLQNNKQSPSYYFKTYGLNKVYSNGKREQNIQQNLNKQVKTSDFISTEAIKVQTHDLNHRRCDTNQFSFGHNYNPMSNNIKIENKDPKTNSKGKSSGKKIVLTGSNKSKEKKNIIRIQSYANTTMFSTNPLKSEPKKIENDVNEKLEEDNEEFNFDF